MKALVYEGRSKVRVRRKPDPKLEHSQDLVLRVARAEECGPDLLLLHYLANTRVGCTFGHEVAAPSEGLTRHG